MLGHPCGHPVCYHTFRMLKLTRIEQAVACLPPARWLMRAVGHWVLQSSQPSIPQALYLCEQLPFILPQATLLL